MRVIDTIIEKKQKKEPYFLFYDGMVFRWDAATGLHRRGAGTEEMSIPIYNVLYKEAIRWGKLIDEKEYWSH